MTNNFTISELVNNPELNEVYVDTLVGMLVENGNLHLTLATSRADPGPVPKQQRHVTARVVMPLATASVIQAQIAQLLGHVRAHAAGERTKDKHLEGAPRKRASRVGARMN
jgi:hypothetical protein